jgi:glycine/D-amino acid oxidase-like deaminating enzyme
MRNLLSAQDQQQKQPNKKRRIVVIGAGAFGGWTALHLLRAGSQVTLVDAWGPGNSRASSGGETRITRATYGPDRIYTNMSLRALEIWKENEKRWHIQLFHQIGFLRMTGPNDEYLRGTLPVLHEAGVEFEELHQPDLERRYPQVHWEGVTWAIYEPGAGYLTARRACEAVLAAFIAESGRYQQLFVKPPAPSDGELHGITLSDGSRLSADAYVFACGPWLGQLFPDVVGKQIVPTRQEVFFFGTPPGETRFFEEQFPVWIDQRFYGIPGNQWRGLKIADDDRGPRFDPTTSERMPTEEAIHQARKYLEFRFPALKAAPLLETRVCQYENSPDHDFIMDRHPQASNVWLVGGGSGHGFKHGPAVGEMMAGLVLGQRTPPERFCLSRLGKFRS